jgi:hypothetical protein
LCAYLPFVYIACAMYFYMNNAGPQGNSLASAEALKAIL